MRSHKDYEAVANIVRQVIAAWDPCGLLAEGAPPEEHDQEVALITARIQKIVSPESAAAQLSEVFTQQFGPERFGVEECREPGRRLYGRLLAAGYVGTQE